MHERPGARPVCGRLRRSAVGGASTASPERRASRTRYGRSSRSWSSRSRRSTGSRDSRRLGPVCSVPAGAEPVPPRPSAPRRSERPAARRGGRAGHRRPPDPAVPHGHGSSGSCVVAVSPTRDRRALDRQVHLGGAAAASRGRRCDTRAPRSPTATHGPAPHRHAAARRHAPPRPPDRLARARPADRAGLESGASARGCLRRDREVRSGRPVPDGAHGPLGRSA
jgi:hypothetical protein